jgi:hypothetical protein
MTKKYEPSQRREALRKFIEQEKLSVLGWTKKAGLAESGVRHFLAERSQSLNDGTYEQLAHAASLLLKRPVSASELRGEGDLGKVPMVDTTGIIRTGRLRAPKPTPDDLSDFAISQTLKGWAFRPLGIDDSANVSCFDMPVETMDPWREAGDPIYFERDRIPPSDGYAILEGTPFERRDEKQENFLPVVIGRVIEQTKKQWVLRQFNPADDLIILASSVKRVHRVIDWPELFGTRPSPAKWESMLADHRGPKRLSVRSIRR